jgi:hypothetical protein
MVNKWLLVLCAGVLVAACSKKEGDAPAPADAAPAAEAAPAAAAEAPAAAAEAVTVSKEVVLPLAPAALWAKVGDFNGLNTWHPAIAQSEIVSGENNATGAHRKLTLADGAVVVEELAARDDAGMTLTYTIVEGPLPVVDYRSTLTVVPEGEGSKLSWSGTFKPAAGVEAAKAQEIIGGIYQAGLDNLAKPAGG